MRVVTAQAVGGSEGLVLMRLLQVRVFYVVAVQAQSRSSFRKVELILGGGVSAGLVSDVAGLATHVESGMAAAFFRNVYPLVVAAEAEVLLLVSRGRLQQLVLVIGTVGVVAGKAIAGRGLVHVALI